MFVSGPRQAKVTDLSASAMSERDRNSTAWAGCSFRRRLKDLEARDAALAMIVVRLDGFSHHRPAAAGIDLDIAAAGELADHARVALREIDAGIAGYHGDAEDLQGVGRGEGQQQGDRVVLTGIAIHDDSPSGHS